MLSVGAVPAVLAVVMAGIAPTGLDPDASQGEGDGSHVGSEPVGRQIEPYSVGAVGVEPDGATAQLSAVALGGPVEVLGLRTSHSSTFAMPDGTWLETPYMSTRWVLVAGDGSEESDWAFADPTLVAGDDGSYTPVAVPSDTWLSGGGDGEVLFHTTVGPGNDVLELLWPGGSIPAPQIEGARATYPQVWPGVDFVLDIQVEGFEQYFVVHSEQAMAAVGEWGLSLAAPTLAIGDADGEPVLVDGDGEVAFALSSGFAWDADADAYSVRPVLQEWSDELPDLPGVRPTSEWLTEAQKDLVEHYTAGHVDQPAEPIGLTLNERDGGLWLGIDVDEEWWRGEDVEYPLVIDPAGATLNASFDTYVNSGYPSSSYHTRTEFFVGTPNSGTHKYRTFLNFNYAPAADARIYEAQLAVYMHHSWSCSARQWEVINAHAATSSTNWSNQPGVGSHDTRASTTRGYSTSCAAGWATVDITPMVEHMVDTFGSHGTKRGIRLRSVSETDNYGWKRFFSSNYHPDATPLVSIRFNTPPSQPVDVMVDGRQAAQGEIVVLDDFADVELTATTTDPEGASVSMTWEVLGLDGSVVAGPFTSGTGASGEPSSEAVSLGLQPGVQYRVRATGSDAKDDSDASTVTSWTFAVPTAAPDTPTGLTRDGDPSRPTLSAMVSDPDGGQVQAVFSVWREGVLIADEIFTDGVPSGSVASVQLPFAITPGYAYTFAVEAFDGVQRSSGAFHDPTIVQRDVSVPREVPTTSDPGASAQGGNS